MTIILFGPPGSGKGTQSILIAQKYNLKHISTGDILRKEMEMNSELGIAARSFIQQGKLVPDEIIINMLMEVIKCLDTNLKGVLLDGFPRTVAQAEALEKNLALNNSKTDLVFELQVNHKELTDRMLLRGIATGRVDDNLETIINRLQVYTDQTLPVKIFYQQLNCFVSVQGVGEIDEIFNNICLQIDKQFKKNQ